MNVHGVIQSMQPLSTIKTARDVRVLRDANATPEEVLALVRAIRDQVFHFRQTAEALVAKVDRSPRLCAGVLLLIEQRLRYAQVSYELFDEIADKEFVVETQRYISTHTSRLLQAIAPFELTEVLDMVYAYEQIDDLKYFIEHIDTVQAVAQLHAQIHVSNAQKTIQYTLAIATSAIVGLSWVLSPWLSLVLLVVGVALIVWYTQTQQQCAQKLHSLAKKCDNHQRVISMQPRYHSKEMARAMLEHNQRTVKAFFGDMSPTSHLTGIFTIIQMQVETQQAASVRA
jgi:uncharacterized membrane protein